MIRNHIWEKGWVTGVAHSEMMYVDEYWSKYRFVDPIFKVMLRDGYMCVITGYKDVSHPQSNEDDPYISLQAAHILCRSIGKFDNDRSSTSVGRLSVQCITYRLPDLTFTSFIQFKSAVTTFDILRNFTRIPVAKLEDLHSHLDDSSNGMMLELHAHNAFDNFKWCLKKTEVSVPFL